MPLLFAVTLFWSASLLFMVQPMVGKMILPLLGGSPAVWNACMVFFQVLLLLGYLYAHWVSTKYDPKAQGKVHLLVLGCALGAFALSAALGQRNTPIAIVDGLAPTDGANPFVAVLLLLTAAIGIPFFVASTSAPLLQRWFSFTGHPSARDPYFLYAASNVGSLVSLLGYPLFIEPTLTIAQQAWMFAIGFAILTGLIVACGQAAANPIGVPPAGKGGNGKAKVIDGPTEPPPSPLRVAKWILLAFVPSSFMLSVTFYMSTDIASIPLLWVIPLALYLVTFIIAFSTLVPPWFRVVLGNVAPVMLLLLVFVLTSQATGNKMALTLSIHIAAFFFAALMCHYELARDRPKDVSHLTQYFVWMSVGGMLGGMFNGLVAPIVFTYANEYPITIVVACGMVPVFAAAARPAGRLFPNLSGTVGEIAEWAGTAGVVLGVFAACLAVCYVAVYTLAGFEYWYLLALIPAWFVVYKWKTLQTSEYAESDNPEELPMAKLSRSAKKTSYATVLDIAVPVTVALVFWRLTGWEADAYLQTSNFTKTVKAIASYIPVFEDSLVAKMVVYGIPVMACFFFVDRPVRFALCVASILAINAYRERQNDRIVMTDRSFFGILKVEQDVYRGQTRLVHGTTLHGTQFNEHWRLHRADPPIIFGSLTPWDALALNASLVKWDARQEPLTYYHRTGPVGAMFYELRSRKNGADAKADIAMVGLGTGSAACYCLPGQKLTFYEIDPAVKDIVEAPKMVMNKEEVAKGEPAVYGPITYVQGARDRGALIDFRMGDARLKLRDDQDRKYALLLVDAFSSDAIPVHLLTKQAVAMYFDRMTPDGILALHISNKYVRLEPVVAAIAQDLGVHARVWNDDSEGRPGKTASSWVALAKDEKTLGILAAPAVEQIKAFGTQNEPLNLLLTKYGADKPGMEAILAEWGGSDAEQKNLDLTKMSIREGPQAAQLLRLAGQFREAGQPNASLGKMAEYMYGGGRGRDPMFHKLKVLPDVPVWTDDYSDVLRVIMIPQIQKVRKAFGFPTPVEE